MGRMPMPREQAFSHTADRGFLPGSNVAARRNFYPHRCRPAARRETAELCRRPRRRSRLEQHVGADGRCSARIEERDRQHPEPRNPRAGRDAVREFLRRLAALHAVARGDLHREEPGGKGSALACHCCCVIEF